MLTLAARLALRPVSFKADRIKVTETHRGVLGSEALSGRTYLL